MADDKRNRRQIQADGREWGHHLHRKTPHLIQDGSQQSTVSSPLLSWASALFIEEDSSGVEGCKADVSRGSGIVHQRPGHQCNQELRGSRAYCPDFLSIFNLKNLGPLATEHLTSLYNDSLKSCRLPSIWKTSLVIPIPKPGKDSSQGISYSHISMLCPAAKVLEALMLLSTYPSCV